MKIKKYALITSFIIAISGCGGSDDSTDNSSPQIKATSLTASWSSIAGGLDTPESVIHDDVNRVLYVANINSSVSGQNWEDNSGYISKLDENGSIIETQWATGLNAPKGMTINNDKLYVADLNTVSVINTVSGNILNTYTAPSGLDNLNDIAYDESNDVVYVSDSFDDVIYKMTTDGVFTMFYEEETSDSYQNGLYVDGANLIMTGQNGKIKSINTSTNELTEIAEGITQSVDGIWKYNSTGFIVSTLNGVIYFVGYDGIVSELLNTDPSKTADISYSSSLNLLLVPDFNDKVIAYTVN